MEIRVLATGMAARNHGRSLLGLFLCGAAILCVLPSVRSREPSSITTDPGFYDSLRSNSSTLFMSVTKGSNSSIYNLEFAQDGNTTVYRLAEIKAFMRFSLQDKVIPQLRNEGFAVVLAMYHFNNMLELGHPVLGEQVLLDPNLASCNVKLTMELFDGQGSAAISTRTFSSVVRRIQSFQTPPTTAVIGGSYSSETFPLAVYTGVNSIPQVSASATSSLLDDKDSFPLFGRTVLSTYDEAAVVARLFHAVGSKHVAIIFSTDTYISAMHKGFLREAANLEIMTESLVYSDPTNIEETRGVIAWLKRLQFRHVLVLCYEDALLPIMQTADELGVAGPGYFYVFPAFDVTTHIESFRLQAGSALARSLHGTALVQMRGGDMPDRIVTNKPTVPSFNEESDSGVDKFRVAWRNAHRDPTFVEYVQGKLPTSLDDVPDFVRNASFSDDPSGFQNFQYDAVTALGIAMCRAGANTTFFTGDDIYGQFRRLDFEGASGRNKILNETGTRSYTTIAFIAWNVRITDEVSDGNSVIEYVPSFFLDGESWKEVPGNAFEFADGSTTAPGSIPLVAFNYNYIGTPSRAVAWSLMAITMIAAVAALVWAIYYRANHVVDSAQPLFLVMAAVGAFVMVSSIVPLSLEEAVTTSQRSLNASCMLTPWLYFTGAGIAVSGLLAKAKAVHKAYMDPTVEEIQVSPIDMLKVASVLVSVNFVITLSWSLVSPLKWTRIVKSKTDSFDRPTESYAVCESEHSIFFAVILVGANIGYLLRGTFWAYRTRNIATEYNESRFVGMALAAVLQVWLMGVPVVLALRKNPAPTFFVMGGLIVVTSMIVLLLVYVPKIIAVVKDRGINTQELRELYKSFKRLASMAHFADDNDESTEHRVEPETQPSRRNVVEEAPHVEPSAPVSSSTNRIKIIHNPRSTRNLKRTGGLELSLEQTKFLQLSSQSKSESSNGAKDDFKLSSLSGSEKSPRNSLYRVDEHGEYTGTEDADQRMSEEASLFVPERRKSI